VCLTIIEPQAGRKEKENEREQMEKKGEMSFNWLFKPAGHQQSTASCDTCIIIHKKRSLILS